MAKYRWFRWLFGAALVAFAPQADAKEFPTRPITIIVPWQAGGSTDTQLRKIAEIAARHLGQPIIIENKPGAGGTLGPSTMAATAKPDGYTLSQYPISLIRLSHMTKASWDPLKDFTFVIGLSGFTFGAVVKADSPFNTLGDLVKWAKANPGKMSYGSNGIGTSPHLLMEELAMRAGVEFLHVPFKGNVDAAQALLGGHIMAQSDATGWARQVDAGTFRLLVTFGETRTKWNAPTAKELGYDVVSYSPYGIVGPKGMDPATVRVLHDAFRKALDDPEHLKTLQALDQVRWYQSSADFSKWAAETYRQEYTTLERLGLLAK
jgi:tripartite-type tricarboxylate transporter receptor subunit TctC